jgi:hypothetical protein
MAVLKMKKTVDAMDKILELKNIVHQKFLKIAKRARIKDEDGKSTTHEFCCLMRLQALLIAIQDTSNPTVGQLREMEVLANSICGRDRFIYKPVDWCGLDYDTTEDDNSPPISACDIVYENPNLDTDHQTVCSYLDKIIDTLNYESPWIKFSVKSGLTPGTYEVGEGATLTEVGVTVNKTAKNFYDLDQNGTLVQYARELQNGLPDQQLPINFETFEEQDYKLHGEYYDLQKYHNQHLKAETELAWKSRWPIYYGVGPLNALDSNPNAFIQSLTKIFDFQESYEVDITEGNVLYFFYPFNQIKYEIVTENGVLRGSYKGSLDGVRTLSMDNNNVAGEKEYGVIRTDEIGIRFLKFRIEEMLIDAEIPMPQLIPVIDVTTFESVWSDKGCVKIES